MAAKETCPCCSDKPYNTCCKPYLEDGKIPPTAEALMRSRYVAYAKRNNDYLLQTWHNSTRPEDTSPADDTVDWIGLQILRTEQGGESDNEGVVEFRARCRINGTAGGVDESSRFVKEEGRWYYVDGGGIQPIRTRHERVGRNDPCPCGSGKKYKKCCGAN